MTNEIEIRRQIFKFKMYGFLKNLRFFEPYLVVYLLISNLDLLEIGLLYSIREIIVYIFEIPSGVIADRYGKKLELVLCFIFYILSFAFFFIGGTFYIFVIAMVLFGFGEAFRSGTHKAMIMAYLERRDIKSSKSEVYGSTRAFSMLGSSLSSLISIGLIFVLPDIKWFFIIVMIPYTLDLLLILSYPSCLNERRDVSFSFKEFIKENIASITYVFKNKKLVKVLLSSSGYNGTFKTLKDYIQPILLASGIGLFYFIDSDKIDDTYLTLGVLYAIVYFISAIASKYSSVFASKVGLEKTIDLAWLGFGLSVLLISIFNDNIVLVGIAFIFMYIATNIRRPLMVEKVGNKITQSKRASVLSIESQFTSLLVIVLAPLLGFIAEYYSIRLMMASVAVLIIVLYFLIVFSKIYSKDSLSEELDI